MEPKGVYKKYTCKRGMPKYGLVDPNEAPTMKTKHLAGTEREHIHNERPSHGNTEEAHGPMQAGQTAAQIVRRERLMTKKRTKAEAKAEAIEGGFPEEKANKVFAKHKKPFYKHITKMPTLPPKKMKVKESYVGQIGPSKPDEKMNRRYS